MLEGREHAMPCILVDSNKYLMFYERERLSSLIETLERVRPDVCVPQMVVDEVRRGRVACLAKALKQGLEMPKWKLPVHLLPESKQREKLLDDFKEHGNRSEALRRRIEDELAELGQNVASGDDHISQRLERYFSEALAPTRAELDAAMHRKSIGNPPGKASDPLGDQLIWEQFLSASSEAEDVWIVSGDGDYFVKSGARLDLNPLLQHDLLKGDRKTRHWHCFENLGEALDHYVAARKLSDAKLPSEAELKTIGQTETELAQASRIILPGTDTWGMGNIVTSGYTPPRTSFGGSSGARPIQLCRRCGQELTFILVERGLPTYLCASCTSASKEGGPG